MVKKIFLGGWKKNILGIFFGMWTSEADFGGGPRRCTLEADLGGRPRRWTREVDPGGTGAGGTPLAVTQEDCLVRWGSFLVIGRSFQTGDVPACNGRKVPPYLLVMALHFQPFHIR